MIPLPQSRTQSAGAVSRHPAGARSAVGLIALAVTVAGLAGCGSTAAPAGTGATTDSFPASHHTASAGATSTPTTGSSPIAAINACQGSTLQVALDSDAAGAAAGSSFVPLVFTNTSADSCSLPSYPAVEFAAAAAGPPIGTPAVTAQSVQSGSFVLAAHGVAHAWVQIGNAASYPAGQCKPTQAGGLRVSFTGSDVTAFLAHPLQACTRAVHGSEILSVFPVQAGQAKRGTAP
jgi:hypothetical protein